jgi:hypothetical protein
MNRRQRSRLLWQGISLPEDIYLYRTSQTYIKTYINAGSQWNLNPGPTCSKGRRQYETAQPLYWHIQGQKNVSDICCSTWWKGDRIKQLSRHFDPLIQIPRWGDLWHKVVVFRWVQHIYQKIDESIISVFQKVSTEMQLITSHFSRLGYINHD